MGPPVPYAGRPGVSPAAAVLIALGDIRADDRILDVGCGTGTEALLLAEWGCKSVTGIDLDSGAIGIARGRATKRKLTDRVTFHTMDARDIPERLPGTHFDVILHTLVANNLERDELVPHFEALARIIHRKGIMLMQERVTHHDENGPPDSFPPWEALADRFHVSPGVSTHLPERRHAPSAPDHARIVLWVARPR